ncbi:PREDICTED: guanine nucleotide exchange factor VAV2-like isoform X2 [Priapulus caudatus]|uniref:Guanine nucleotide exchange factor VAV2-like isoform X2 n=1 Tax=Priapulus caudatus TaxID=37621 RepID=A0ABM1F0H9_PRICU|nr:PREDICTED: guanine nucleotide exchange factor VAV2-like isoform X2 [Priapulus caudatus]
MWPTSQVFDLAQILRDGVLLCQLANKLLPNSIDVKEISNRPQMSQFLCLKNIRTFLTACQHTFGMRSHELFDSFMLFDMTDFGKVLQALSKLSRSHKALATGIPGFPQDHPDERHYYNEEIYSHLEELATSNDLMDEDPYREVREDELGREDIYEDLCAYRSRKELEQPLLEKKPADKREYCIRELVETEKNYVDALNMIVSHFARPLKPIIPEEDFRLVFKHMEDLCMIHTGFHSELHRAYVTGVPTFAECFLKWRDKFLLYGDFCSNLPHAQDLIDELCNSRELVKQTVINCQEKANEGKFRLRDLLSVPMQRVLKYHLLLKELIKQTSDDSEEKPELQRALDALLDLSLYINEVKRDNETLEIIREIQNNITDLVMPEGTELKDYGHFLKDGELRIKSHADNRIKNRYVFLFDKVMLMCKPSRGQFYSYKEAIILSNYSIQEQTVSSFKKDKWSHCWVMYEKQRTMAFHMYAKTEEVKRKWIDAIHMAQDNTQPDDLKNTSHRFQLHSFEVPTTCTVCNKLLRGTFCQGYKCMSPICNAAVHKECILGSKCGKRSHSNNSLAPTVEPRAHLGKYKITQPYQSTIPGHISLNEGDVVLLLSSNEPEPLWQGHCLRTGLQGLFPRTHAVKVVPADRIKPQAGYLQAEPLNLAGAANNLDSSHNYYNLDLEHQPWYVGEMDKDAAQRRLELMPDETFLVRKNVTDRGFRIAIKYEGSVKHIKVVYKKTPKETWYLAESRSFSSLLDLVNWYTNNSLAENFENLTTTLAMPFRTAMKRASGRGGVAIGYCVARYGYSATATNQLSFRRGDRIAITDKSGENKGWWKGELAGKIAYFPMTYVEEE